MTLKGGCAPRDGDDLTAPELAGRAAVVTDGCGAIGRAIVASCVAAGARACALDIAPPPEGTDWIAADVRDDASGGCRHRGGSNAVMGGSTSWSTVPAEIVDAAISESLLAKLLDPTDVARLVVFLSGPGGSGITGQVLRVDAGQYLGG